MLRYFIDRAHSSPAGPPARLMCAPSGATDVEQRAVQEACLAAGAREVKPHPGAMAAAIGAGLPVAEPTASMVGDVGGGTSEVAVISLGGMVVSRSVRWAGYDLDEAITSSLRRQHNLAIGEQTSEETKITLGSAWRPVDGERTVRGRDLVSGLPKELTSPGSSRHALTQPVAAIVGAVKATLEETPPELASDIVNTDAAGRRRLPAARGIPSGCTRRRACRLARPRTRSARSPRARQGAREIELLANTGGQRRGWVAIGRR